MGWITRATFIAAELLPTGRRLKAYLDKSSIYIFLDILILTSPLWAIVTTLVLLEPRVRYRPKGWKNERTEAKDLVARVEAAGGNKYMLDGTVDYGV